MAVPDKRAAAAAIDAFLRAIGRDASTERDLEGTGERVADAFVDELCAGYAIDTRRALSAAVIEGQAAGLVVVREIPVVTTCPHHLMPAVGSADVAMQTKAGGKIIGIGAIGELVDAHAHRLTLQEQIGEGVVADLDAVLAPAWVACRIVLSHGCMIARGTRPLGTKVETISVRNVDAATFTTILRGAEP